MEKYLLKYPLKKEIRTFKRIHFISKQHNLRNYVKLSEIKIKVCVKSGHSNKTEYVITILVITV